jgi:hypothetical protein
MKRTRFALSTRLAQGLSAGLLGFLIIGTSVAQATPLYTATVGDGQDGYPTLTRNGPMAVEATLNSSVPVGDNATDTKNQFAAAGPSGLRASPRVTLSAAYSGSIPVLGDASDIGFADAKMQLDDVRFRGINGDRSGSTLASLNLDLSGTFLTNVNAFADPGNPAMYGASARASASVSVMVSVTDPIFGTVQGDSFSFFQSNDTSGNLTGSLFDSGRFTTKPFSFYNGIDNKLTIELYIRVQGDAGGFSTSFDAFADGLADFGHTVTFATSGPVFNIPDGYSVNSVEAQISGNLFVPEPASLTLLGVGVVVVLGWRSRRRTTRNVVK